MIAVPEHHHSLRANGPAQRLDLPRLSLEALWGDAGFCPTCMVATGDDDDDDGKSSSICVQVCDSLGLVYFSLTSSSAYIACIFGGIYE